MRGAAPRAALSAASRPTQLLRFLQEFSQQTISRTHEIKKQVDGLISETKAADCRLHNVFNDFLMLSNTQFIENVSRRAQGARLYRTQSCNGLPGF